MARGWLGGGVKKTEKRVFNDRPRHKAVTLSVSVSLSKLCFQLLLTRASLLPQLCTSLSFCLSPSPSQSLSLSPRRYSLSLQLRVCKTNNSYFIMLYWKIFKSAVAPRSCVCVCLCAIACVNDWMAKLLGTKSVTEKEERGSQKRGGGEGGRDNIHWQLGGKKGHAGGAGLL